MLPGTPGPFLLKVWLKFTINIYISQVKTLKFVVVEAQFRSNTEPVDITNLIIFVYHSETKKDTLL